jgi:light-regulated signal transduction histidine kinase (bacteriophytochrome)
MGFTKVIHDVTERKLAEQANQRLSAALIETNAKLQRANSELQLFAYEVAHDIRTPVHGTCIFAELLSSSFGSASPERQRELLDQLVRCSGNLRDLIESLLEYGTLAKEAEAAELISLEETMKQVRENLNTAIAEAKADVTWGSMPVIKSRPVRMVRLFQNLVSNAIKYARPGIPPVVHISAEFQLGQYHFVVSDNGIGIKPEFIDKIFAPLKRLHSWRSLELGSAWQSVNELWKRKEAASGLTRCQGQVRPFTSQSRFTLANKKSYT